MNVTGHIMQSLGTGLPNSLGIVLVLMYDPLFPKPIVYVGLGEWDLSMKWAIDLVMEDLTGSSIEKPKNLCDGGSSWKDTKIICMVLFVK